MSLSGPHKINPPLPLPPFPNHFPLPSPPLTPITLLLAPPYLSVPPPSLPSPSVASLAMGHWGTCPHSSFGNSVHSAASCSLTVKISKITKEKHVLHFPLSRQKHAETHVNRLKQSLN